MKDETPQSSAARFGIALGSNLGDRIANLQRGAALILERVPGARLIAAGGLYETDPVDCPPGSLAFLNSVIEIDAAVDSHALHEHLARIELELGRPAQREHHAPRSLDLDILHAGSTVVRSATLQVPHPRLHVRRFVLRPLADCSPALVLPGLGGPVAALLGDLKDDPASVRLVAARWLDAGRPASSMLTSLSDLPARKQSGPPIAVLTAYDYPTARLLDEAGVDLILVGDSLGMMVMGLPDTTGVRMADMLHHTRAVRRGTTRAPVIGDLPYHSYRTADQALHNARRLASAGADAVKLEGGRSMEAQVRAITGAGIPFMGHIGMLPQSILEEGRYKKKGKTPSEAERLLDDALCLQEAGAFAIVLESIVPEVAAEITRAVGIPTIGIGAGSQCDGQVLVVNDLLGSFPWFRPPFAKPRADLAGDTLRAAREFVSAVRAGQ